VFEVLFDGAFLTANPVAGGVYDYDCHPHGLDRMIGSVSVSAASVQARHWRWYAVQSALYPSPPKVNR